MGFPMMPQFLKFLFGDKGPVLSHLLLFYDPLDVFDFKEQLLAPFDFGHKCLHKMSIIAGDHVN